MKKILIAWLPLALAITMICGIIELTVQQSYRMSADDPQIQYSEDVAASFKDAKDAPNLVPQDKTDISASLATFGIVYGKDGAMLASSAVLDGKTPSLPAGVIDYANKHGKDTFTWEPKKGVRVAAVITKGDGGYILIGRNIREVEIREDKLNIIVLAGWLSTLLLTFFSIVILLYFSNKKPSKKAEKTV